MNRPLALLAAAALAACAPAEAQVSWERRDPLRTVRVAPFENKDLDESSGLAASRAYPGVLWTIEDSGTGPDIFAVDTLGRHLWSWEVAGIANADWEAIGLGPCRRGSCLYIGDTGDNTGKRAHVTLYRVREPNPAVRTRYLRGAESVSFRFPDGRPDVEALIVTPKQDVLLITKARVGSPQLYRVPASAWRATQPVTAELLGILPLPDGGVVGRVTDAALSPDGSRVVVRTYVDLYFFELAANGGLTPARPPIVCGIFGLELQGEGVDWLDERRLALSGERQMGVAGGIAIVECPDR